MPGYCCSSSAFSTSSRSVLRAQSARLSPRAANSRAMPSPRPELAPVMRMLLLIAVFLYQWGSKIQGLFRLALFLGFCRFNRILGCHPGQLLADHGRQTIGLIYRQLNGTSAKIHIRMLLAEALYFFKDLSPQALPVAGRIVLMGPMHFQPHFATRHADLDRLTNHLNRRAFLHLIDKP